MVLAEKLSSAAGFSSLGRGWQLIPTEKVKVLESDVMPCCEGRTRDILFSDHISDHGRTEHALLYATEQ